MFIGDTPFVSSSNQSTESAMDGLRLQFSPALPHWLFRDDNTVGFTFLGTTRVMYVSHFSRFFIVSHFFASRKLTVCLSLIPDIITPTVGTPGTKKRQLPTWMLQLKEIRANLKLCVLKGQALVMTSRKRFVLGELVLLTHIFARNYQSQNLYILYNTTHD